MTIPPGLRKPIKKRALKRRNEFKKQCDSVSNKDIHNDDSILTDCLTKGNELLEDYDWLYADCINNPSVKHLTRELCDHIDRCKKLYEEFADNEKNYDIIKLQEYIKTFSETIDEYENMMKSLGCDDFTIQE